jgi:sugar O-acyltransferase (sialic acid O-acetyltransferase NeuD family)
MKIAIVGAGGHGSVVADILCSMREAGHAIDPIGFVDDGVSPSVTQVLSLPVFPGGLAALMRLEFDAVIVAIGDNETRRRITDGLRRGGVRLAVASHPRSTVARDTVIEPGAMICAGASIGPAARVGAGTIVNTNASVDHHNWIGDYAHVAPGAHLGGMVEVGDGTLIGIGASVLPGRRIGCRVTVGAGAVVVSDLGDDLTAVGVPARVMAGASRAGREPAFILSERKP